MKQVVIVYSTTDGQTRKICHRLKHVIERHGHQVTLILVEDETTIDLVQFDTVIVGASIRYGKHRPEIIRFIEKNRSLLESKPNAFFSVNVVARKPGKNQPEQNPYLQKFLKRISWCPRNLAVFAGKIDYPSYRPIDRWMIRLIMWMTKGPTNPDAVVEFTDWQQVEHFGERISAL